MKIFTLKQDLSAYLLGVKSRGNTIGFVPTMGALHQGHLSLIDIARASGDTVVCRIFVNQTQFNDPKDLEKYPRPVEADIEKLKNEGCDVLFLPSTDEMYVANETWHIDLGYLENILEGEFRPGHYQGVTQIVKKLFDVVSPDKAFFGQKDYQQVMVINRMVEIFKMPVEIIMCPILREADGLAMSSRNIHLSATERKQALALSQSLLDAKRNFTMSTLEVLEQQSAGFLENREGIKLEYFKICNANTLLPAKSKDEDGLIALVAAKVGATRLIDNIIIK